MRAAYSAFVRVIQNAWFPNQMKGISDYDATHLFSVFMVAELPFGTNKRFLSGANPFTNALVGGWQISTIWRQSSGLPASVGDGGNWPTDWQFAPDATQIGPVPGQHTTKNAPPAQTSSASPRSRRTGPPTGPREAWAFSLDTAGV